MFLYYTLLIDFAAVSTKVSAYVLICIRMGSEVCLFLGAVAVIVLAFSSAISVMEHEIGNFAGILPAGYSLIRVVLSMFDMSRFEELRSAPTVHGLVTIFIICVSIFLTSLFMAQLSCAYSAVYENMLGFARIERGEIIVEVIPDVPKARWYKFVKDMNFSQRLEFNAGDIGLAGGIQMREPTNANPTTEDSIRRFGGSTSSEMQWPADEEDTNENSFGKFEIMLQKTLKRITSIADASRKQGGASQSKSGRGSGGPHQSGSSSSGGSDEPVSP